MAEYKFFNDLGLVHYFYKAILPSRYGLKWKQLYELFDKKRDALEKELQDEKRKLEEQIEYAKYEHETEMLRERKYR